MNSTPWSAPAPPPDSLDAANILKPALARGELRAIGATTLTEYKQHIEKDAALERRFQPIMVDEPSKEETVEILQGLRPNYEKHHNVTITDEAIKSAVELSSRYIQDRYLPDKAVDLIDETAAFLRSINSNSKLLRATKKIESDLAALEEEKTKAVLAQDFTTALHLRAQEEKLLKQKEQLSKSLASGRKNSDARNFFRRHCAHRFYDDQNSSGQTGQNGNRQTGQFGKNL